VRLTTVQFLGRFSCPEIVEALLGRLTDTDSDVRLAAAKALGVIADPAAIEGLVLTLSDEEGTIRQTAERSLDLIDPHWDQSEVAQRAGDQLEAALNQRPAWVRAAASQALSRIRAAGQYS